MPPRSEACPVSTTRPANVPAASLPSSLAQSPQAGSRKYPRNTQRNAAVQTWQHCLSRDQQGIETAAGTPGSRLGSALGARQRSALAPEGRGHRLFLPSLSLSPRHPRLRWLPWTSVPEATFKWPQTMPSLVAASWVKTCFQPPAPGRGHTVQGGGSGSQAPRNSSGGSGPLPSPRHAPLLC